MRQSSDPLELPTVGSQEPQVLISRGIVDYSDAEECVRFGELIGIRLDEWQRLFVRLMLGRDESGRLAHLVVAISIPRQNGKNEALHLVEMYLLVFKGAKILHTAHRVDTAGESFERIREFFDQTSEYPQLVGLVAGGPKHGITRIKGSWEMRLSNGGRILWSVRSGGGRRGFANVSLVVFDEAQDLTEEMMASLKYVMAASKTTRQMVYMGTPPSPDMNGEEFSNVRRKLMSGETSGAYMQFGLLTLGPDPWATVRDKHNWFACNPAMGTRLSVDYTEEAELGTAHTPEEFARERLGWWPEVGVANAAIPPDRWRACETDAPVPEGRTCYAVKFSPDGETGTLAVAVKPDDGGPVFVEVVEHRSMRDGVAPFAAWLLARRDKACSVVVDGAANARALTDKLLVGDGRARYPRSAIPALRYRDVATACSMLLDAAREGTVAHHGQPALQEAIEGTCKRTIGSGGGWGFGAARDGIDPCVPEAVALAYYAARTTKRDVRRKGRIG